VWRFFRIFESMAASSRIYSSAGWCRGLIFRERG
jgi:hypothetical protein